MPLGDPNPLEERAVKSAIGMSSLTFGFAIWLSKGALAIGSDLRVVSKFPR